MEAGARPEPVQSLPVYQKGFCAGMFLRRLNVFPAAVLEVGHL